MKLKKIASLVLACAMFLSLSVPAFAANDEETLSQSTEITGDTKVPKIKIVVPDAGSVVLNPYAMSVKVKDGAIDDTNGTASTDQVISAVQYIQNQSDVAIKVTAAVTGAVADGSTMTLATAATNGDRPATAKSAFIYFEMVQTDSASATPTWGDTYDSKALNMIAVANKKTTTKANIMTLAAGTGTAIASAGGCAAFHLVGDAAPAPAENWVAADKVNVSIAFTFTPTATSTATP